MNDQLKFKGIFFRKQAGGEDKGWALMLCRDQQTGKNFAVFCTNFFPKLRVYYDVVIEKNKRDSFNLLSMIESAPDYGDDLVKFITSNIKTIGKITAEKIVAKYGKDIFEQLAQDNNMEINELSDKQKEEMLKFIPSFNKVDVEFFTGNNMFLFYEQLKNNFVLEKGTFVDYFKSTNPYILYLEHNMNIIDVDKFALCLGVVNEKSILRFEAIITYIFKEMESDNHTIFELEATFVSLNKIFEFSRDDFIYLFGQMLLKKVIVEVEIDNKKMFSLNETRTKELGIVSTLSNINNKKIVNVFETTEFNLKHLDEYQLDAFKNAMLKNVSIISGGPGTGKTYLIRELVNTFTKNANNVGEEIQILTPTGRVSSNITKKSRYLAKTIHSFLSISRDEELKTGVITDFLKKNWDSLKILIIDEFSMVNLNIFSALLSRCKNIEKIIIIGDSDQLPAIGPGNILNDLIALKKFKVSYLKNNHRSESLDIFNHYNALNNHQIPSFVKQTVINIDNSLDNNEFISMYNKEVKKNSLDDVIVLSPMYSGKSGLIELNNILQKELNDSGAFVLSKKERGIVVNYKIGDKVIQTLNRTLDGVFNGDFGYIDSIEQHTEKDNSKSITIKVKFKNVANETGEVKEKILEYTEVEFRQEISLAYAVSIHKFQGSESQIVFYIMSPNHESMNRKKLVYTGISRAKKRLYIVGSINYYLYLVSKFKKEKDDIRTNISTLLK
ncbi:AAA family ATPase [Mycoplasmopsis alligatoris]|uniref:Helicase, RecD/TraA family n=1 Tax=Mycoplasmopsis alligatoris A21JP2 TaxID=747682 RepID=D4XWH6_9BACT|nr:AAA family ATPase [Mycoplasmopsis alligatoris]EFF41303.1 helicase, RecD/TraA family [Mycoplasmopsis alligatoris A21JP2]